MIKPTVHTAFVVLLLLIATAARAGPQYALKVDGLACPFCTYGIEKQLTALDGVERIETHIKDGAVIVTMQDGATLDKARAEQAVKDAGFTLNGFEPVSQQANQ